jgi:hypothetical protein
MFVIIALAVITLLTYTGFAKEIPAETIIAEYDGGQITYGDIEFRISKISPMFQHKYQTYDGKVKLLDMMCTEELFYQEALTTNVAQDPRFNERIDLQIKTVYYREYKQDIMQKISITDEELAAYYRDHQEEFPGKTLEEAKAAVENSVRRNKETELLADTKDALIAQYGFAINDDIFTKIDRENLENNEAILNETLVTSSDADQSRSVAYFINVLNEMPPAQKTRMAEEKSFRDYLNYYMETSAYYLAAVKHGYDTNASIVEAVDQINKTMLLRTIYNTLVIDKIDHSETGIRAYYDEHIEEFSSRHYRTIQAFEFDSEEMAQQLRKEYRKALGYGFLGFKSKPDTTALAQLIKDHSLAPKKEGILDYVYQNDIIPGQGKDAAYSQKVWEAKVEEISEVFTTAKGKFAFFRLVQDHPAQPDEFDSKKVDMVMQKNLAKELFEEVNLQLEEKYHLKKYPERLEVRLTAEEYFTKAEEAQKSRRFKDAIFYYDQIIKYYKNNTDDYKAAFMKAFLHAEEMNQKEEALTQFKAFIQNFPEGELHESANFMINELEGKSDFLQSFDK